MKKFQLVILFILFDVVGIQSQNLNPTSHIWLSGTADDFKGGYTFSYATSGTAWNGSLISFGGFANNYDTQISSDYFFNRISFRTRNGDTGNWNPWIELATKGVNDFIGNQSIIGNLEIMGSSQLGYEVGTLKLKSSTINQFMYFGYDDQYSAGYIQSVRPGTEQQNILIAPVGGNVGIGTKSPDAKLTVAGNIHAQEVKVTINAGLVPDYVFANDYKLKSLQEVEEYVKENNHLPEIPSAQEIENNGLMLAEMNLNLLKKMEEMTLYMIEIKKENEEQNKKIRVLENKIISQK